MKDLSEKHIHRTISLPYSVSNRCDEYCKTYGRQFSVLVSKALTEFLDQTSPNDYSAKEAEARAIIAQATKTLEEVGAAKAKAAQEYEKVNAVRKTPSYIEALEAYIINRKEHDAKGNPLPEANMVVFGKRFGITVNAVKEDIAAFEEKKRVEREAFEAAHNVAVTNPEYANDLKKYIEERTKLASVRDTDGMKKLIDTYAKKWGVRMADFQTDAIKGL